MKPHPLFTLTKPTAQEIERLFTVLTGRAPTASEMAEVRSTLTEIENVKQLGSQYDDETGVNEKLLRGGK